MERFALREPFTISRGSKTEALVLVVHLEEGRRVGRGEVVPYGRFGETVQSVRAALKSGSELEGAAAAAMDLAALELEARGRDVRVWELLGLEEPVPVPTLFTLPIRSVDETRRLAAEHAWRPWLKLKVGGDDDLACVRAVREGAPDARLVVDANEGWDLATLCRIADELSALGVELIEQPLPAADDAHLLEYSGPVPLCADESFVGPADQIDGLSERYSAVNLKIDKCGGLRPALACAERARARGLKVMVGSMVSTSLALAPAVLLAQGADWADLDGPLHLATDRVPPLHYDAQGCVHPPTGELWG